VAARARTFEHVRVSTGSVAIAALLLVTGYLLGTRGSDRTADNASEPTAAKPSETAVAPPAMNGAAFWTLIEGARRRRP
jgi:hypothetical protein